jgi:RNA polymerase sigma-70 factor, ECF subfamily
VISTDERNLLEALRRNDRSAIDTIFKRHHAALCRISFRITNDADEAKDVVQEVFIKLWRNRTELSIDYSLEAYLRRAVVNTSLNRIESKKRFTSLDPQDPTHREIGERIVEQQQSLAELSSQVDFAINKLPIRTKAVFTLIRLEDMSYREVSESLNISIKAVEKEMMKALKLLRETLKDYLPFLLFPVLSIL